MSVAGPGWGIRVSVNALKSMQSKIIHIYFIIKKNPLVQNSNTAAIPDVNNILL